MPRPPGLLYLEYRRHALLGLSLAVPKSGFYAGCGGIGLQKGGHAPAKFARSFEARAARRRVGIVLHAATLTRSSRRATLEVDELRQEARNAHGRN